MAEPDMEKFRRAFLDEAAELLEQVNEDTLKIESDNDPELVNSIFRAVHTIKGSAAGFGFDHITAFTHHLETLLDKVRDKKIDITPELIDSILKAADGIYEMVQAAREGRSYNVDEKGIRLELEAYYEPVQAVTEAAEDFEPLAGADAAYVSCAGIREKLRKIGRRQGSIYRADFRFDRGMLENGYDLLPVMSNLKASSAEYFCKVDTDAVPTLSALDPFDIYMNPEVYVISELDAADLADFGFEKGVIAVAEAVLDEPDNTAEVQAEGKKQTVKDESLLITLEGIDRELLDELALSIEDYFESVESVTIRLEKGETGIGPGIDDLFRVFHTIKGDCGYVGFKFLEEFAHLVESVLDDIRAGRITFDKKAADIILTIVSDIRKMLTGLIKDGVTYIPDSYHMLKNLSLNIDEMKSTMTVINDEVKIFINQLEQFIEIMAMASSGDEINARQMQRGAVGLKNAASFVGFDELSAVAAELEGCIRQSLPFDKYIKEINRYLDDLKSPPKKLGELLVREGKVTDSDVKFALSKQKRIGDILVEEGRLEQQDLNRVLKKQEAMKAVSEGVKDGSATTAKQQAAGLPQELGSQTMKVDQEKIDKFTNTIGELVVARNANEYLIQKIAAEYDLPSNLIKELKDNANLIGRISQDLQRDILSLRMMPIKQVFNKFPRVVRDVSRKQNKQIDLRIIGEDTEIDKKVADLLSDPLVHLLRNSCDHGIEGPEERSRAGKPALGTIILKAYQEGSFVYIEVIDDGKGIDTKKVREKAVENKLIGTDADLTDHEIMQLILEPGFSTADKVTDISGRGVGMDVVKNSVINLGGTVDIQSKAGEGSRMVLKIPVTIGVSTALLVKMNAVTYAVPIENVAETIKVGREKIKDLHYGLAVHYRGMVLPLHGLASLLDEEAKEPAEEVCIVITNTDVGKVGLMVDEFINRTDIAVKPVPEYFAHLAYVGGITILGDGQAVLVLNTNKLI